MGDSILVVAPHADDMEIGVGGIISAVQRTSAVRVFLLLLSASPYRASGGAWVPGEVRIAEQQRACEILGVELMDSSRLIRENHFVVDENLVWTIETAAVAAEARTVFFPLPSVNQDHEATFRACRAAFRSFSRTPVVRQLCYESPVGSADSALPPYGTSPVYWRLTEADVKKKLTALDVHASQRNGTVSFDEDLYFVEAARHGRHCGCRYAERVFALKEVI